MHARCPAGWDGVSRVSKLELREKIAFLVVGGMNGLCYLVSAWVLHFFGLSPTLSSAAAYALCIPPGYLGQRWHTFRSTRPHSIAWIRYLAAQGIGLLVATAATFIASAVLGLPALLAFFLAAVAAASASYLIQKFWVF
jgi:putative flippase GtrA